MSKVTWSKGWWDEIGKDPKVEWEDSIEEFFTGLVNVVNEYNPHLEHLSRLLAPNEDYRTRILVASYNYWHAFPLGGGPISSNGSWGRKKLVVKTLDDIPLQAEVNGRYVGSLERLLAEVITLAFKGHNIKIKIIEKPEKEE